MKCDLVRLQALIEQRSDPGPEADVIAAHIEHCHECRRRLEEIAEQPEWWNDAKSCLSDPSSTLHNDAAQLASPDFSFLAPPSHPEMLGRLGRYEVEGVVGRGGMGVVFRAHDADLHRTVAIKVMSPDWAQSIQSRRRFAREAQAAASITHDNVIPIYDVESTGPCPFIVMRYVRGITLDKWVQLHGPPDSATVLRIAGQLAEGLHAAHRRGLVHRDIKPANILVGDHIDRVWITDFGLARAAHRSTVTSSGFLVGTPQYMSPEQARGEKVDQRSDLFSLGSVLYFLCTGEPPFGANDSLAILYRVVSQDVPRLTVKRADLPPSFVSLIERLCEKQVDRRMQKSETVLEIMNKAQCEHLAGKIAKQPLTSAQRWIRYAGGVTIVLGCALTAMRHVGIRVDQRVAAILTGSAWSTTASNAVDRPSPRSVPPEIVSSRSGSPGDGPRTTQQIFRAEETEALRYQSRIRRIERELQRMAGPSLDVLDVVDDDDRWHREVAALQAAIEDSRAD